MARAITRFILHLHSTADSTSSVFSSIYEKYDNDYENPFLFLRTIATVPQLSSYITQLAWHQTDTAHQPADHYFSKEEARLLSSRMQKTRHAFQQRLATSFERWYSALESHSGNQGILLLFLSCLRIFHTTSSIAPTRASYPNTPAPWQALLRHGGTDAFPCLHTLKIKIHHQHAEKGPLVTLFNIPTVKWLEIANLYQGSVNHMPFQPKSSNVEAIILRTSCVEDTVLASMIDASKELITLVYEHTKADSQMRLDHQAEPFHHPSLRASLIASVLERHASTLRHLAIISEEHNGLYGFTPFEENECSFKNFGALQHIVLPSWWFWCLDREVIQDMWHLCTSLPKGIPSVSIKSCVSARAYDVIMKGKGLGDDMPVLARSLISHLPHLQQFHYGFFHSSTPDVHGDHLWEEVKEYC